ncbi:flavin monoamine oxidase family protein [Amycolatopsis keratiniphila]|uniref:flavin monoamine oxidase family protein n=1 Tax=Amycolatopsis keratiniphila TaxID=129921 RepID=UPI00087B57AD|nr:NAD(P)/FAD-dependent oxidoreductase [Amycolatopsis keratiniphila]OLZ52750.1 oxidase [Amycolatopsis keratiniphila subsp. nogabecina]SDU09215.1 monoamine oxidase [Amycolatopsis keratiniphila]
MIELETEVVVIGAGMAGLMAATALSDRDVVVLEATDRAGGRVESVRQGDYWINLGTQFTEGTGPLIEALERHQVAMGTLAGKKVALALHGKQVDTSNPFGLMFRSRMTFLDRLGLAAVGARILAAAPFLQMNPGNRLAKRVRAKLDALSASYVLRGIGSEVARDMVRSWSGQWMGCEPEETAATQFVFSMGILLTDPAKVPNFSLPEGGNQTLTDVLAADLGDRLRLNSPVTSVEWTEDGIVVDYADENGPARIRARRAIVAVPSDVAVKLMPGLPPEYRSAFDDIRYGRYVVVGFFTHEEGPQRWDDYIAVSTPQLSFQAMFNHAAALRGPGARKPGGALACFAGGAVADNLFELTDEEIVSRFTADLLSLYPELEGKLDEGIVRRHHRVVPFWAPGGRASLPTLRRPLGPVHLAGDYQLDMPSLADAASSGERAAEQVRASLPRSAN